MAINFTKIPTSLNLPSNPPTDLKSALSYINSMSAAIQLQNTILANVLNNGFGADVIANQPVDTPTTPISIGSLFYATDVSHFYVFTTTGWVQLI